MKTLKYFAMLFLLVCFAACSSDDNSSKSSNNHFTYKGKTYELKAGIIEKDGTDWSDDGSMEYYLTLVTSNLSFDDDNDIWPTENLFSLINFNLYSKNKNHPNTGTYKINEEYNVDYTIEDAMVVLDINWVEGEDELVGTFLFITSGNVKLHKTGNTYKMDFEFTTHTNEIIKGHYEGKLIAYDYDEGQARPEVRSLFQKKLQ